MRASCGHPRERSLNETTTVARWRLTPASTAWVMIALVSDLPFGGNSKRDRAGQPLPTGRFAVRLIAPEAQVNVAAVDWLIKFV